MTRRTTFSGGLKIGPNAYSNQLESDQLRNIAGNDYEVSQISTWFTDWGNGAPTVDVNPWVIDLVHVFPLRFMRSAATLTKAKVFVSAPIAGSLMICCLYTKVPGAGTLLTKVPGTEVTFNTNAAGEVVVPLRDGVRVPEGCLVYFAWLFATAVPTLSSSPTTCFGNLYTLRGYVGTSLRNSVDVSTLSSYSFEVPAAMYTTPLIEVF